MEGAHPFEAWKCWFPLGDPPSNGLVEGRCVKERPSGASQMNHWRLLMAIEAYCVKCKAKKEMQDPVEGVTKNGKPITKGKCPDCGTTICRIGAAK